MGTSLINGVKLWKHKGKEHHMPYPSVEANEKGPFGSPRDYKMSNLDFLLKKCKKMRKNVWKWEENVEKMFGFQLN